MKKIKILHVIDHLGFGGAQTVVKGIFEKQKDNKDIFLYALRKRKENIKITHDNINIENSNAKLSLIPLLTLNRIIKKEKIEIIHCHLFRSQVYGWVLKKLFFPKIKLIFHEHGRIFQNSWYFLFFLKIAQQRVDLFIAVSKTTKSRLIKARVPKKKILVLYNFVDLEKFNRKNIIWNVQKEKEKLGIKKEDYILGFAGRLIKMKGWRTFIRAANLLKNKKDIKFLIVGDGPERKKMLTMIKGNNLREKVFYLGYVKNMIWFYSLVGCLAIPSYWESMGLVAAEAQSMGVVVLAANVPALNEVIIDKKNGLLFKKNNTKDLVDKIKIIYGNEKLRKKLIKNGLKNIKKYSLNNYVSKLNKLYRKIQSKL